MNSMNGLQYAWLEKVTAILLEESWTPILCQRLSLFS